MKPDTDIDILCLFQIVSVSTYDFVLNPKYSKFFCYAFYLRRRPHFKCQGMAVVKSCQNSFPKSYQTS